MSGEEKKVTGFLSPVERFSEILFGLIMTLSITGTMSIVAGGREEVVTMLLGVLGCNIAWGIIDGVLYLLGTVAERGRGYTLYEIIRQSEEVEKAREAVAEALPPAIASVVPAEDLDAIRRRILDLPVPARRRVITREDLGGAAAVCVMVIFSCVPLLAPFLVIRDPWRALRVSNGVAILMLFVGGYFLAKYSGLPKIWTGLVMVVLGVMMVGITILLGG